jgi:hypothetical protein
MSDQRPDLTPEAFMAEQAATEPAALVQELPPQTDEDILAAALMTACGDAPARAAIVRCRAAHPEHFDLFMRTMAYVAEVCQPDWDRISLQEYVEAMYAVVMHADFMAEHRRKIFQAVQAPSGRLN